MTKVDSSAEKWVSFDLDDIIYEVSGKGVVTVMGFAGYPARELVIPSRVTSPDGLEYTVVKNTKDAFKGMKPVEWAVIPDTVVEVGKNAYKECLSLKNLTVPTSIKCPHGSKNHAFKDIRFTYRSSQRGLMDSNGGTTTSGNRGRNPWMNSPSTRIRSITTSFKDWRYLESITLKDVESIMEGQFRMYDNLVTVTVPHVRTVHDNAFMDCSGLSKVDLSLLPFPNVLPSTSSSLHAPFFPVNRHTYGWSPPCVFTLVGELPLFSPIQHR